MSTHKKFDFFPMRNLSTNAQLPDDMNDTDFKTRYPPDVLGRELDDHARVWRVYRDQAIKHDDETANAWTNTVDILLTFSGLFSAVVTAFVVESYQLLQPGNGGSVAGPALVLGTDDSAAVRSAFMHSSLSSSSSSTARWVNGLWFTSLVLSLTAALLCMLVKQWLDKYLDRTRLQSHSPKHWCRRRAFYYRGFQTWGMADIVSAIPALLHLAVVFFLAGLGVFLLPLDIEIAVWLICYSVAVALIYVIAIALAFRSEAWPFTTPLVDQLHRMWNSLVISVLSQALSVSTSVTAITIRVRHLWFPDSNLETAWLDRFSLWEALKEAQSTFGLSTFDQLIQADASQNDDDAPSLRNALDCAALSWLVLSVSDSDSSAVGFQAVGAVDPSSELATLLRHGPLSRYASERDWWVSSAGGCGPIEISRVIRSFLVIEGYEESKRPIDVETSRHHLRLIDCIHDRFWALLGGISQYPDFQLLFHALLLPLEPEGPETDWEYNFLVRAGTAGQWWSPSHSTALLLSSLDCAHLRHILLFLTFCDMDIISSAQWTSIMRTRSSGAMGCPIHSLNRDACDMNCFVELLCSHLLEGRTDFAVTRLLDSACRSASWQRLTWLTPGPFLRRYITSGGLLSGAHYVSTLWRICARLDDLTGCDITDIATLDRLTVWNAVAHALHTQHDAGFIPINLLTATLSPYCSGHSLPLCPNDLARSRSGDRSQTESVLRAILLSPNGDRDVSMSIWDLITTADRYGDLTTHTGAIVDMLLTCLCMMTRRGDRVDELIEASFRSLRFDLLMTHLNGLENSSANSAASDAKRAAVSILTHSLELRPSWWTEGMLQLIHDGGNSGGVPASTLVYAVSIAHDLRLVGPCADCPSPPAAFSPSFYTFSLPALTILS